MSYQGSTSLFQDSVLIIPSISQANIPQLACDLLITSLSLRRIGFLGDGSTCAPMVGMGDDGELVTGGMEVYGRDGTGVVVIQQRAPVIPSQSQTHLSLLQTFITTHPFLSTLLLTSLSLSSALSPTALTHPIRSILPPQLMPPASLPGLARVPTYLEKEEDEEYPPEMPEGGLARRLLGLCKGGTVACLAMWCVEGDNTGDAIGFTQAILFVLGKETTKITQPPSWAGLLGGLGTQGGTGHDSDIYG